MSFPSGAATMKKNVYLQTVGCQMNVLDSELVAADLLAAGFEVVDSQRQADVILFNTCSVRQHAEDKIYSALGRLKEVKDRHPDKIIGVIGCMAQKDQQAIFRRAPHVDLVVGPGQIRRIPELLERLAVERTPQIEVSLDRTPDNRSLVQLSFERHDPPRVVKARGVPHQAMVRIMFGCDKCCAYCVVPSVRGPEQNRPAAEIEREVRELVDQGCLEVTLLGQAVNSYRDTSEGCIVRLPDLLYRLHDIAGLARLRFVTNYPRHVTRELIEAVRDLPKISPYLHIPAQSGSNAVLKRMKRAYTVGQYDEMLAMIREMVPHASVTSDFIVGYCGETEPEFEATMELVRRARFRNSFIFKYSQRPGTPAASMFADDVPEDVKRRRNNELLAVQNQISLEDNVPWVGRIVEVLVEGPSKVGRKQAEQGETVQLIGRTTCDRIIVFDGPRELAGKLLPVEIVRADAFTLLGQLPPARHGVDRLDAVDELDGVDQPVPRASLKTEH